MPEGHTLRKLANDLGSAFADRRVRVQSPTGRFAADAAPIDATVLVDAASAGKHLFLELGGERVIHVQLGLIGKFDITGRVEEVQLPVGQVRLTLAAAADGRPPA